MNPPPRWTREQLAAAGDAAAGHFRAGRATEPLERKVSNSATNSVKRLNNDAAVQAEVWRHDFGNQQVVPAAVLGGVYKLRNLENAQERGLTLFWAHDLQPMLDWIHQTRESA